MNSIQTELLLTSIGVPEDRDVKAVRWIKVLWYSYSHENQLILHKSPGTPDDNEHYNQPANTNYVSVTH